MRDRRLRRAGESGHTRGLRRAHHPPRNEGVLAPTCSGHTDLRQPQNCHWACWEMRVRARALPTRVGVKPAAGKCEGRHPSDALLVSSRYDRNTNIGWLSQVTTIHIGHYCSVFKQQSPTRVAKRSSVCPLGPADLHNLQHVAVPCLCMLTLADLASAGNAGKRLVRITSRCPHDPFDPSSS